MVFYLDSEKTAAEIPEIIKSRGLALVDLRKAPLDESIDPDMILLCDGSNQENVRHLREFPQARLLLPTTKFTTPEQFARFVDDAKAIGPSSLTRHLRGRSELILERTLLHSSERWDLITEVGRRAEEADAFFDFPEVLMTITSELLTNAFYNAPKSAQGRALQPDRTADVSIHPPMKVHFRVDETSDSFNLTVSDSFGTLTREQVVSDFLRSTKSDKLIARMNPLAGGAGLGLQMVLNWSSDLLFRFDEGRESVVSVHVLKSKRRKSFQSQACSIELLGGR